MKIKSFIADIFTSSQVAKRRKEAIKNASSEPSGFDPIAKTARSLHPGKILLEVIQIRQENANCKTLCFTSAMKKPLPPFKAGEFLTLKMNIASSFATRPYSISSAPYQIKKDNIIEITVQSFSGQGFVSDYLYNQVKVGDTFYSEIGLGQFYVDPIRDSKHIVGIAGGSAVSVFLSMAKEIRYGSASDIDLTLFYGCNSSKDILFLKELQACLCSRFKLVVVVSDLEDEYDGEKGLITSEIISKYVDNEDSTYFICGPKGLYDHIQNELAKLHIPARRIRFAPCGQERDISLCKNYPIDKKNDVFKIKVLQGITETVIPSRADESIATALERANLYIHTRCRSGECGICRVRVIKGDYYVNPEKDYRRAIDKDFDYVHACSTYPLSDLEIRINIQ